MGRRNNDLLALLMPLHSANHSNSAQTLHKDCKALEILAFDLPEGVVYYYNAVAGYKDCSTRTDFGKACANWLGVCCKFGCVSM